MLFAGCDHRLGVVLTNGIVITTSYRHHELGIVITNEVRDLFSIA